MTRRDKALGLARTGQIVTLVALLALAGVFIRALMFTPMDRLQGLAQKILYVHAPAATIALMAFAICGILSLIYLGLRDRRLDRAAAASAEVGVVFSVMLLITGPLWGKPVWGTWWTWDARLTSTLFIFLLFVGYLIMRDSVIDPDQRARFSSVIGVLGLALVPFIHLTVYLFRTLHPDPMLVKPSAPSMPEVMLVTFLSSLGVLGLLYVGFVVQRYALADLQELRNEEMMRDS
jgi:heme exporter protein C